MSHSNMIGVCQNRECSMPLKGHMSKGHCSSNPTLLEYIFSSQFKVVISFLQRHHSVLLEVLYFLLKQLQCVQHNCHKRNLNFNQQSFPHKLQETPYRDASNCYKSVHKYTTLLTSFGRNMVWEVQLLPEPPVIKYA